MHVNSAIFRGYDLRGLVGTDLSPELAEALGKAFGTYLKRHGITQAVVGRDSRETSPLYSQQLIAGLVWAGIDVVDIGMLLVGMFYWSQYYLQRPGGVYVSASHNPPEYNGFKFANGYSETLVSEGMQTLCRMIETDDFEQGATPGTSTTQDIRQAYYDDLLKRLPTDKKFRIVVDPGCTTSGAIAPVLLRQAGHEVVEYNTNVDPTFPLGIADPTESTVMERVKKETLEARADVGFTYDADGDRIGIVDEKGNIIWNDVLIALLAADVLREHPGATIMFNTLCSRVVSDTIRSHGGVSYMWRTGHSFLKKKNQEVKAAFIGELSGHFFFSADFYNHDDGLYSTMRVLNYLASTNKTLSQAIGELPQYISSPEIKLSCADDKKVALVDKLSPILRRDYPDAEVIDDQRAGDGLRMELPDAMFVLRYSQNGPYLTVKFEAKTKQEYEQLRVYIANLLHTFPEVDWQNKISTNVEAIDPDAVPRKAGE
jgi:phosphomannomutase / phosphoglucomutase